MNYAFTQGMMRQREEQGMDIAASGSRQVTTDMLITNKKTRNHYEMSNDEIRGIPGCSKCNGTGFKMSTDRFGLNKICKSCQELQNKFLPKNRGIAGCNYCSGVGFIKCGNESVQPCQSCLRMTGFCSSCLDTGYKLLYETKCDHRRT